MWKVECGRWNVEGGMWKGIEIVLYAVTVAAT
jgi:hypothetical protein